MEIREKMAIKNAIDQIGLDSIVRILCDSFLIKTNIRKAASISKKEELIEDFSALLEKHLQFHFTTSSSDRLEMINFIDKLNQQKELLEIEKGKLTIADVEKASERLSKKAQSGFEMKQ